MQKSSDLTSATVLQKSFGKSSRELLAENSPDSHEQIRKYIRLNELIDPILSMVDEGKIGLRTAVELSYLPEEEQEIVHTTSESDGAPSFAMAQRLRKLSADKKLNYDTALDVMMEQKKRPLAETNAEKQKNDPTTNGFLIPANKVQHYFPGIEPDRIEKMIYNLLDGWLRAQNIAQNKQKGKNVPER